MTSLLGLAGQALNLAERQAEATARRTALKLAGGAVAAVFFCVAIGFAGFGVFLLLDTELGAVTASFLTALGALLLAIIALQVSRNLAATRKTNNHGLPPELMAQLDTLSREAGQEIGKAAPYIVVAGFVAGFLSGRK
jgi:uncharacterized membrane protein YfcA